MGLPKGNIPWNKGLTGMHLNPKYEFTSERVKKFWRDPVYREKMRKRKVWNRGKSFAHPNNCECPFCRAKRGEFTPWNKNLKGTHFSPKTEFTSERLKELWQDSAHRGKMKRRRIWNKGLTKEDHPKIKRMAVTRMGKGNPMYGKHPSNETLMKSIKMWRLKPNRKEKFLIGLFEKHNLPFQYVGDGKLIIGGRCPDFSDGNGRLIEFFGDYWHEPEEEQERIEFFKEHGYNCLVVWGHELKDEEAVASKVAAFSA